MTCCPVMKSLTILSALAVTGYVGYEATTLYARYADADTPKCCHSSGTKSVVVSATPEDESCCSAAGEGACCKPGSRAATLVQQNTADEACCEETTALTAAATPVAATVVVAEGWSNVKGQVVFGGDTLPKAEESKVTADQAHCLAKGALVDKVWDVNPSNKGLAGVVVFILPERDEKLAVHPDLQAAPAPFVLDQPYCVFTPRVFAIRVGQSITAKNPDPVAHNVVIKGLKNDLNVQVPPGTEKSLKLVAETNAVSVACGSHPWMKGYGWCFDHPYFAVTDKDGKFEIKNVPAGNRKIVIWHETGYLPGYGKRDNKTLNLAAGSTADVGTVKAMPK